MTKTTIKTPSAKKPILPKKAKNQRNMPQFFINAFYHSKFRDNLFVIKAGGKVIEDKKALDDLIADIRNLNLMGIKVLLVYGGGEALDRAVEARGNGIKRENGRRVTDPATMQIMKEVVGGDLSLKVYESMAREYLEGITLNAVPPEWMRTVMRPKKPVDYGLVGDIKTVNARPIRRLFKSHDFVAVACMAWTEKEKKLVNINADTIATQLAMGVEAHKLIFLSDVDGVQVDGKAVPIITDKDIPEMISSGKATGGMKVKLENCLEALKGGVRRIHLINGFRHNALSKEIFEPVGPCTMLILESERDHYNNEVAAQMLLEGHK